MEYITDRTIAIMVTGFLLTLFTAVVAYWPTDDSKDCEETR
jgi:hypothetical protein